MKTVSKMNNVEFGRFLRMDRISSGLSIRDVAKATSLSDGIVRFIETNFRNPSPRSRSILESVLFQFPELKAQKDEKRAYRKAQRVV